VGARDAMLITLFWHMQRMLLWLTGVLSVLIATTCALVRVTAPADGAPMLSAHVLPRLLAGRPHLLLQRLGVSFHFAYALAVLIIITVSVALLRRAKRDSTSFAQEETRAP
jgi:uncharacterized sodium:solute symporter family permease YidK